MKPTDPNHANRRTFLRTTATAALGGLALGSSAVRAAETEKLAASTGEIQGDTYLEPAKAVPISARADVVVCGAGPAGVTAAIAAARSGAKTRLIEVNGCLGGIWTGGLLCYILDSANKSGIMPEILARLEQRENPRRAPAMRDPEAMKLVLEEMCREAGVEVRLHTQCAAAVRDANRRLKLVITESKSGREAVAGKVFIDATGDGDLAHQAGCSWDYGRPGTDDAQPMSFIVLLTGIHLDEVRDYASGMPSVKWSVPKDALAAAIEKTTGFGPSYAKPSLFPIREDMFCLMANHEYGFKGTDAEQLTQATLQGRAELHRMIDGLRSLGGPWKNLRICASPERIGVRESRRIHGRYAITNEDIASGATFDDAVCRCTFCVDVHATKPDKGKGIEKATIKAKAFDIPYRAMVAKDVDGLLMAGRCISGSFFAHAAYRVTGNAVAMGEAAGRAAAVAVQKNLLPHEVDWAAIRKA